MYDDMMSLRIQPCNILKSLSVSIVRVCYSEHLTHLNTYIHFLSHLPFYHFLKLFATFSSSIIFCIFSPIHPFTTFPIFFIHHIHNVFHLAKASKALYNHCLTLYPCPLSEPAILNISPLIF